MPPDTYGFGKTLGSTDGTGREVRFAFTTTISPEWDYMDAEATVKPGYTDNYYRFFMQKGLMWGDVREMLNYGVGIALHDMNTPSVDLPDSILRHYGIAQQIVLDRLSGRGCKMLAEPNGNKTYVTAAMSYDPIQTIFVQSGGGRLRPFAVEGDLVKTVLERGFWQPKDIPGVIEAQLARPVAEREAVSIGAHGTDRTWSGDAVAAQQHPRQGRRRLHVDARSRGVFRIQLPAPACRRGDPGREDALTLTVTLPGGLYFYYPSLTLNVSGVDPASCTAVGGRRNGHGLSWAPGREAAEGAEVLAVNFDCRHALAAHAEHFVEVYEADPSAANRADARYFVAMLKDSDCKEKLLERIK